jgi:hypothetical protein
LRVWSFEPKLVSVKVSGDSRWSNESDMGNEMRRPIGMSDLKLRETACKPVYFRSCQQTVRDEYRLPSMEYIFGNLGTDQNSSFKDVKCW